MVLRNFPQAVLSIILPLLLSFLLSIVPIIISKSNYRLKNHFGYGIPLLLLLMLPFFIYYYYSCHSYSFNNGTFCEVGALVYGGLSVATAIIFSLFYTMGKYGAIWNVKFILSVIAVELISVIGLYFIFFK